MLNGIKKLYTKIDPFTARRREQLRAGLENRDFTLITSNCIGGIIYHELGLEFKSPTINLMITTDEFAEFVLDLPGYLDKKLRFIESQENYPVAMLGDVKISFTHYHTQEEAEEKWEARKRRICWDNLFLLFNDRDGITEQQMEEIGRLQYRGIVMLSAKERRSVPYALYMDCYAGEPCVGNVLKKSFPTEIRQFERYFDYVKWFNESNGGDYTCEKYRLKGK